MAQCAYCQEDVLKRNILCSTHWNALSQVRKTAIRMSTYRRDEIGKKFVTALLTTDEEILRSMIAENRVNMENLAERTGNRQLKEVVVTEIKRQKEELEII